MKKYIEINLDLPAYILNDLCIGKNSELKFYQIYDNTFAAIKDSSYSDYKIDLYLITLFDSNYTINHFNINNLNDITFHDNEAQSLIIKDARAKTTILFSLKEGIIIAKDYNFIIYDEIDKEYTVVYNLITTNGFVVPFFGILNEEGHLINHTLYNRDFGTLHVNEENLADSTSQYIDNVSKKISKSLKRKIPGRDFQMYKQN